MYLVGDVKRKAQRLVEITYESMLRGIAAVNSGCNLCGRQSHPLGQEMPTKKSFNSKLDPIADENSTMKERHQ